MIKKGDVMDCIKKKSIYSEDINTLTVASDLKNLLAAIKGRTILMKHRINPSNPLQSHFDEIIHCIDESAEITNLLMAQQAH